MLRCCRYDERHARRDAKSVAMMAQRQTRSAIYDVFRHFRYHDTPRRYGAADAFYVSSIFRYHVARHAPDAAMLIIYADARHCYTLRHAYYAMAFRYIYVFFAAAADAEAPHDATPSISSSSFTPID